MIVTAWKMCWTETKSVKMSVWCGSKQFKWINVKIHPCILHFESFQVPFCFLPGLLLCVLDWSDTPQDASLPFKLISAFLSFSCTYLVTCSVTSERQRDGASLLGKQRRHCSHLSQIYPATQKEAFWLAFRGLQIQEATWTRWRYSRCRVGEFTSHMLWTCLWCQPLEQNRQNKSW